MAREVGKSRKRVPHVITSTINGKRWLKKRTGMNKRRSLQFFLLEREKGEKKARKGRDTVIL